MYEARRPSPNMPSAASTALGQAPDQPVLRGRLSAKTLSDLKSPSSGSTPSLSDLKSPPLARRRSSILSFNSLDDTRHSARDFIRPGLGFANDDTTLAEEPSHWHSSPIAFAFLPALAGLFFTNGSSFVTDILLLGLAALFLNWSVRLPWDWYRSAQAVVAAMPHSRRSSINLDDSLHTSPQDSLADLKEMDEKEQDASPTSSKTNASTLPSRPSVHETAEQRENAADAASDLRTHERSALVLTFVMPVCAAYLLHLIRGQLSRPSEGLVSDYNLSIFLLAAEIRPVRQLIRLVTNRTLHLQRIVNATSEPSAFSGKRDKTLDEIAGRLATLEAKSSTNALVPVMASVVQQEEMAGLSAEMKRRYEPRLDALERAVRRYEKRATTLTLLTEQRLQSLEARLQDALSLAAVAAQSSNKPGAAVTVFSYVVKIVMLPLDVLWVLMFWPLNIAHGLIQKTSDVVYGRPKRRSRRSESAQPRSRSGKKKDDGYFGRSH